MGIPAETRAVTGVEIRVETGAETRAETKVEALSLILIGRVKLENAPVVGGVTTLPKASR